jgi:hypothetical protein
VVLACVACAGTRAGKPGVESLLTESRAAIVGLDFQRAQELAEEAERLYPDSKPAKSWAEQLREGAGPWRPPEPSQPAPGPGPSVVPGALLFVSGPSLPLMEKPTASGEALDSLPLGAAVSVLAVEGSWARVTRVRLMSGLLTSGAPPRWHTLPPDSPGEMAVGYLSARFLESTPVDPSALRRQVRTLLDAGFREEALAAMERLIVAEPGDRELARELHRLALELERIPAAVRAARTFHEERPPVEELSLAPSLLYGCRGDVLAAEVQSEATANTEATDACVSDVDVRPVKNVLSLAVCSTADGLTEEEQEARGQVIAEAHERMERDRIRHAEEQEAYEARLSKLRERYPQGPYLDELRLPYVAPGDTLEVCWQVPRYEDAFFGAVLAPDTRAAVDFVRRREAAQAEVVDNPRSSERRQLEEAVEAISAELPHVQLSTAFEPNCNLDCY